MHIAPLKPIDTRSVATAEPRVTLHQSRSSTPGTTEAIVPLQRLPFYTGRGSVILLSHVASVLSRDVTIKPRPILNYSYKSQP
jgi:hypothetical protein